MKGMFSMLPYIYEDLKEACQNLPVSLAAGCAVMILVFFICRFTRRRIPLIPVFLWAAYLEQLLWLVYLNRAPGSRRSLDLGLFDTISRSAQGNSYVAENVLLFLPFGFLFPMLFPFRRRRRFRFPACLLSALLCNAGIETVQYLTSRGYSQMDDIVTNVAGAVLGYAIFYTAHRAAGGRKR